MAIHTLCDYVVIAPLWRRQRRDVVETSKLTLDAALTAQESELGSARGSRGQAIPALVKALNLKPSWSATDIASAVARTGVAKSDYVKGRVSELRSAFATLITEGHFYVGNVRYDVAKHVATEVRPGPAPVADKK